MSTRASPTPPSGVLELTILVQSSSPIQKQPLPCASTTPFLPSCNIAKTWILMHLTPQIMAMFPMSSSSSKPCISGSKTYVSSLSLTHTHPMKPWQHDGLPPQSQAEKKAFKETINTLKFRTDEENFEEAQAQAYRSWTESKVPPSVAQLFHDPQLDTLDASCKCSSFPLSLSSQRSSMIHSKHLPSSIFYPLSRLLQHNHLIRYLFPAPSPT